MKISDFTELELEHYRNTCNFVGAEVDLFHLRSKGIPLESIAEILGYTSDGIKKVSRRVNSKILKVQEHK